jgi:tRNA pseudouridine13 synthase
MPGKSEPDWTLLNSDELRLLSAARHLRKLHRGTHRSNRFVVILREVLGDKQQIEECLKNIASHGVPNYFGEQRFGYAGGNLDGYLAMQQGERFPPSVRSHYLSAARSFLFNEILGRRVAQSTWNRAVAGDIFMLSGTQSVFTEPLSDSIVARVSEADLHPTGLLQGKAGKLVTSEVVADQEQEVINQWPQFAAGLADVGMNAERRSLRLPVRELSWSWPEANVLRIAFSLPSGCFATAVVRELATLQPAS